MRILDIEIGVQPLVRRAGRAVQTIGSRVGVLQVTSRARNEGIEVQRAGQPPGRLDHSKFCLSTLDRLSGKNLANQSLDEVRVRREPIHPLPPPELRIGLNNTVKGQDKGEEETKQNARDLRRWTHRCNGLPDGGVVNREQDSEKEVCVSSPVRRETHRPVPAQEKQRRSEHVPGDLHEDLGGDECCPRIDPARTFSDLVNLAQVQEDDLQLIRERHAQNQRHEYCKEFVLRALERVVALEESEPYEQTSDDIQHELGLQVRWGSPIMCEIAP